MVALRVLLWESPKAVSMAGKLVVSMVVSLDD
jgi:hypothetical protein